MYSEKQAGGHRRTAAAQHGARQLFGSMPKATQLSAFGSAAMRRKPGQGGEALPTASGGNLGRAEVNRDRADAAVTQPRQSRLRVRKGRQAPAISRATAAALPGGQHGTPRMQMLAEAYGRTEGLSAGPRFVLAQAPAEGGTEGLVPTCPSEDASAEQNGRGEE